MSNSRNWNDDYSKAIAELAQYKKSLAEALKLQTGLEKRIKQETAKQAKERKLYEDEKNNLLKNIEQLNTQNEKLYAYCEQLELDLIKANDEIKKITEALEQLTASTFENKTANKEIVNTVTPPPVAVTEPVAQVNVPKIIAQVTEIAPAATVGTSNLSMFSPWRILGYTDAKSTPTQENPAHTSLADLTKASVEQVLAENNVSGYTPK